MIKKAFDITPALVVLAPSGSLSGITELKVKGERPKGTRKIDRVRAVVIGDLFLIGQDSPEGVKVVFRERLVEIEKTENDWHILTESGKIIAVTKDKNCACGTKLKSWNPYGSYVPSTQDPTS